MVMYNIYLNNEKVQKNGAKCAVCVQMRTVLCLGTNVNVRVFRLLCILL